MNDDERRSRVGAICALTAFAWWGFIPVYFKLLSEVQAYEIVAHRILWAAATAVVILALSGQLETFTGLIRHPRRIAFLALSGYLVACNWLVFTWAVINDRILDTSLGYFINPLFSVLLGVVVLRERLRPGQRLSVFIAAAGVAYMVWTTGFLPWIALVLAFTFGLYGLIRKQVDVHPVSGLLTETLFLMPPALGYILWAGSTGAGEFGLHDVPLSGMIMLAGPFTLFPLTMFAAGARRVQLTTMGIMQYVAPSMTFVLAVFIYREPFDVHTLVTFAFIWTSLILFTIEGVVYQRSVTPAPYVPEPAE